MTTAPRFRGIYIALADGDDTKLAVDSLLGTRENARQRHEEVIRPSSRRVLVSR
jgi:hypothetical protein